MIRASSLGAALLLVLAGCDSKVEDGGDGGSGGSTSSLPVTTGGEGGEGGEADGVGGTPATTGAEGPGPTSASSTGSAGGGLPDGCPNDAPYTTVQPEGRPAGAPPGDGGGVLLGVSRWYLGETERNGTHSNTAWQGFGFDVDAILTSDLDGSGNVNGPDLVCVCTPVGGEINAGNVEDGPAGLDNSWGKNILSYLSSIIEDPSEMASDSIAEGTATVAFDLTNVGAGSSYDPVASRYFVLRDGETGTWKYAPESLNGGDPANPKTALPTAYVSTNTWVSAPIDALDVPITFGGIPLPLVIHDAVVSMELSPDRTSALSGVISGTLDTEELVRTLGEVAAQIAGGSDGLCPGDQLFESIVQNIRAASDIMKTGTQTVGVPCDGITIGLGFDAVAVSASGVAAPLEPGPNPCE